MLSELPPTVNCREKKQRLQVLAQLCDAVHTPAYLELAAAYRYDFPEDVAAAHMVYWTALYANVERACARQRRRKARLPLLLCRRKYYEAHAGDVDGADVVVKLARPGIDGVFFHMASYL